MVTQSQVRDTTKATWQIDPGSTYVQFGIRHMGVSTVRGRFPDIAGTIVMDWIAPGRLPSSATAPLLALMGATASRLPMLNTTQSFAPSR